MVCLEMGNTHKSTLKSCTTGSVVVECINVAFRKFMDGVSVHESIDEFINGHGPDEFIPYFVGKLPILCQGFVGICKTKLLSSWFFVFLWFATSLRQQRSRHVHQVSCRKSEEHCEETYGRDSEGFKYSMRATNAHLYPVAMLHYYVRSWTLELKRKCGHIICCLPPDNSNPTSGSPLTTLYSCCRSYQ